MVLPGFEKPWLLALWIQLFGSISSSVVSCIIGLLPKSERPAVRAWLPSPSSSSSPVPGESSNYPFLQPLFFFLLVINWKDHIESKSCVQIYDDFLPTRKMYSEQPLNHLPSPYITISYQVRQCETAMFGGQKNWMPEIPSRLLVIIWASWRKWWEYWLLVL